MNTTSVPPIRLDDIVAARGRVAAGLRLTPCLPAPRLSEILGVTLWLKRDDLQRTGSFKERGARHALLCLTPDERARGVIAASAGNHALGLAYHASQLGVRVTVVMPVNAPEVKITRCRGLGANVVLHGATFEAAQAHATTRAVELGATLVHPFDDLDVIAGQGTLALEILDQVARFDTLIVPVGGGGLLAGVATVLKAIRPEVRIVAVEPVAAPSFAAARSNGAPAVVALASTLADGLAVSRVGDMSFAASAALVDEVVSVSESDLACAVSLLACHAGAVVEGAAAAPLAAMLTGKIRGSSVVLPITGRNIDPRVHTEVVQRGGVRPLMSQPTACAA